MAIADRGLRIEKSRTAPAASSNPQSAIRNRKFISYVVARGWLHLILLTGLGIFIFPFLWMVFTSMKTDDELTSPDWMPAIPSFKSHSPYVLGAPELIKPIGVSEAD